MGLAFRDNYTSVVGWSPWHLDSSDGEADFDSELGYEGDDEGFDQLEPVIAGSSASKLMAYKQWNRVYVRSGKGKPTGVVMLLVAPASQRRGEGTWTAVDPTMRVTFLDTKDRSLVFARPPPGVDFADHPGLTSEQRTTVTIKSEKLIDRRCGATSKDAPSVKRDSRKKGNKSRAFWWVVDLSWTGTTAVWARRHWGASAGISFVMWRVWSFLDLGSWFSAGYAWLVSLSDFMDDSREVYDEVLAMKASGDLDLLVIVVGSGVLLGYCLLTCRRKSFAGMLLVIIGRTMRSHCRFQNTQTCTHCSWM